MNQLRVRPARIKPMRGPPIDAFQTLARIKPRSPARRAISLRARPACATGLCGGAASGLARRNGHPFGPHKLNARKLWPALIQCGKTLARINSMRANFARIKPRLENFGPH